MNTLPVGFATSSFRSKSMLIVSGALGLYLSARSTATTLKL